MFSLYSCPLVKIVQTLIRGVCYDNFGIVSIDYSMKVYLNCLSGMVQNNVFTGRNKKNLSRTIRCILYLEF